MPPVRRRPGGRRILRTPAEVRGGRAGEGSRSGSSLAEHRALAREVAARGMVLLRNEPIDGAPLLPLSAGVVPAGRRGTARRRSQHRRSWLLRRPCPRGCHALAGLRTALPEVEITTAESAGAEAAAAAASGAEAASSSSAIRGGRGRVRGLIRFQAGALCPPSEDPLLSTSWPGCGHRATIRGRDRDSLRLHSEDEAPIHAVAAANPERWSWLWPAPRSLWRPGGRTCPRS